MVKLRVERTIAASPERVFDWLADPANLTAAPPVLRAGFAKGSSRPGVGALREVRGVATDRRHQHGAGAAPDGVAAKWAEPQRVLRTYGFRVATQVA